MVLIKEVKTLEERIEALEDWKEIRDMVRVGIMTEEESSNVKKRIDTYVIGSDYQTALFIVEESSWAIEQRDDELLKKDARYVFFDLDSSFFKARVNETLVFMGVKFVVIRATVKESDGKITGIYRCLRTKTLHVGEDGKIEVVEGARE